MHPFKYTVQSFLTVLYNYHHHHYFNSRKISLPSKEAPYPLAVTLYSLTTQSQATTNLLVPHRSACSDISYKWNHTLCGIFYLASFTYYRIFKVQPCCSIYQYFLFIVK